ncbi:hypothetical protein OOT55_12430 [Marinimicrobium sp. C6131]|uniref:hypothetical protein n=1 Tax=Marinimicrobium sp. C6131 TaxID=3022676 RepID=UPI00223CFBDA|nr:hypothetical protein [Marinimicrobium sp. C6131]UZJ43459.1 hypothetical protein OOT55_12430 [Marinimicrobium sp. C6131]
MRELNEREIKSVNGAFLPLVGLAVGVATRFTANQLVRHYGSSFALAAGAYGAAVEYGGK